MPYFVCLAGYLLGVAALNPSLIDPDPFTQFSQVQIGITGNWHPPVMAAVWGILLDLLARCRITDPAVTIYSLWFVHAFFVWIGLLLCINCLPGFWRNKRPVWMQIVILFLLLWICLTLFTVAQALGKDIGFLGSYMIAAGLCLSLPKKGGSKIAIATVIVLFLFYGTALRYNALFAPIPVLCWLTLQFMPMRFALPFGLVLWFGIAGGIYAVNAHVIKSVRLYTESEMFYSDIWHLNGLTANYILPPNGFGNDFTVINEKFFRERFDNNQLFLRPAFEKINAGLPPEKKILMDKSTAVLYKTEKNVVEKYIDSLRETVRYSKEKAVSELLAVNETDGFRQDADSLRTAWINRIKTDLPVYIKYKTRFFYRLCRYHTMPFWGLNVIVLLPILTAVCVRSIISSDAFKKYLLCLAMIGSAMFYLLPLWICLPSELTRYLYWFYTASFIAIVHFCAHSELFCRIIQTIQGYLEEKSQA
ncbi:MAG: hypothetical protein LBH00_01355 [Planctomycetaceae bacterium]|nr:hypothetical protein [Planctomycetaceae bacterium]